MLDCACKVQQSSQWYLWRSLGTCQLPFVSRLKHFCQQRVAPVICGQKRQGEQDEVIKGYDLFRHDVKKYVFCVSVGISVLHMEREKVLLFDVFFLIVFNTQYIRKTQNVSSAALQLYSWGVFMCFVSQGFSLHYSGRFRSFWSHAITVFLFCFASQNLRWISCSHCV